MLLNKKIKTICRPQNQMYKLATHLHFKCEDSYNGGSEI